MVSERAGGKGEEAGGIFAMRVLHCNCFEEKTFVRRAALEFEMWRVWGRKMPALRGSG